MSLNNIHCILVRPQMGENIGSCARALKNFGIKKLRLVNPRDKWPNQKAKATSVGAKDILNSTLVFNSIENSIKDLDIIFAATSRPRKVNKKIIKLENIKTKIIKNKKIGIFFGPEASGLSNDELTTANYLVKIPTNKNFKSINLSHSVILFCYQLFMIFDKSKNSYKSNYKSLVAKKREIIKFIDFLILNLDKIDFLQPNHKRDTMIRNIKNIFYRIDLSEQEIRILLGIIASLAKTKTKMLD